jgi:ubiquinone/menaquinone biosynthesis C-methylase UbiE
MTDLDRSLETTCTKCHVDWFCDAHSLPWSDDRFDKVIMCNPYGFGFNDEDQSQILLKEIIRVSKNGSQIIIIGHRANKYCAPERVKKRIAGVKDVKLKFREESIDSSIEYVGYAFKTLSGEITIPTNRITIDVAK